nr:hypothetical protein Iba_chr12eCG3310 [Ipomoea batatas]
MYAEKGKKPPPPEVLPIGSRGGRQKCCQSPEGFAAAAGVGSAQCYSCSNSDFRFTGVVTFDLNFFLCCDVVNQITESSGRQVASV